MRRVLIAAAVVGMGLVQAERAQAQAPRRTFSAQAVDEAIEKAVKYLWSQERGGHWPPYGSPPGHFYPAGPTALAAYALMETEVSPQDPRMAKVLKWLANRRTTKTYVLGLRANVWLAADRKTPGSSAVFRKLLYRDAKQLWLSINSRGAYSYESPGMRPKGSGWDNSNTQYGLLGVWAAAQAILEVPQKYWSFHMKHWIRSQGKDGGWPYRTGGDARASASRATMTVAGIASMFVCYDNLSGTRFAGCTGGTDEPHIKKGLDWLEKNFARSMGSPNGYYLYGVERVGLASGYKYFGVQDWYKAGATKLIQRQGANGGWGGGRGGVVETSFALLFLIRGRNAVIMNKLEFDGDWNNRPRDLAMLTRWLNHTFEKTTVNWQIINLRVPVEEWHDAPILYISGAKAPNFKPADIDKLRTFIHQGGAIFSCTECNGAPFRKAIREAYAKMFPQYKLVEAPRGHAIYSKKEMHFELRGRPKFFILSNGVRPLIVHTDVDLPMSWQLRRSTTQRWAFLAATNVAKYVTGAITLLRPRGTTHWPPKPKYTPKRTVKLARLRHGGSFDPEPLAYERFARMLAEQTQTKLTVVGPISIQELAGSGAKVATLTGTGDLKLSKADQEALKTFVAGGGTLVVDAAGGSKKFAESAQKVLKEAFGSFSLRALASATPPYKLKGYDIERVRYRKETAKRLAGKKVGNLKAVLVGGTRPGVIFSREDITAGLVGFPSYTVDGYRPGSAYELMRNIVLMAAGPDKPKTPPKPPVPKRTAPPKKRPNPRRLSPPPRPAKAP